MRHLSMANAPLMEVETHLLLSGRLCYVEPSGLTNAFNSSDEVGKMLSGLTKSLRARAMSR